MGLSKMLDALRPTHKRKSTEKAAEEQKLADEKPAERCRHDPAMRCTLPPGTVGTCKGKPRPDEVHTAMTATRNNAFDYAMGTN